ncbi:hypothetical protein, partial [Klebsiella pneumoniae]|uniref:hypothetical protein n=1 Tax=Klebsiella pneumoniae TaxID=573 RepID=UPI001966C671
RWTCRVACLAFKVPETQFLSVRTQHGADIGLISITEPFSGSLKANGSAKRGLTIPVSIPAKRTINF